MSDGEDDGARKRAAEGRCEVKIVLWADSGVGHHVACVGDWKLEVVPHAGVIRGAVYLEGTELDCCHFRSLDEAKAALEQWVREYVAPFVEAARAEAALAEREACAGIASDVCDSDVSGYMSLGASEIVSAIRARTTPATLSTDTLAAIAEARGLRLVEPEYLAEIESAAPPVLRWGYTAAHASEARVAGWHLSAAPRMWAAIHEESGVKVLSPRPNLASEHENRRAVEALIRSLGVPFRTEEDGGR